MHSPYFDLDYNNECLDLDGWMEFHPEAFELLSVQEHDYLRDYYLTGLKELPDDIFEYREKLMTNRPDLQVSAKMAYRKVAAELGL